MKITLKTIAGLLLTQLCFAQISAKSFRQLPMDTDGRIFDKATPDDDPCALIKVVTPVKNLTFSVGHAFICGDVIQKVGEIWVYVSEEARYMTIHHGQLGVLRRYKIPMPIEPPNTYEMVLQTAKITQIVEEALPGFVVLKSNPSGAAVFIDGQEMAGVTPFQKSLSAGKHTYQIKRKLHETVRGSFTIQQGKTLKISKDLLPAYGTLQVSTTPGAQIYIDRQPAGEGELTKVLAPGRYYVEITKANHYPIRKNITIQKRKKSQINAPLKAKKGILELSSNPIETQVYIDGERVGETPLIKRLAVGNYKLTLKKQGYQPQEITLQITHRKTTRSTVTLKKGSPTWERTYGGSDEDVAESIVATSDGGYAVAGYTKSKGAGSYDIWLLKLDSSGAVVWERTYGGSDWDDAKSIVATSDGGYAVAGYTESKGAGFEDIWLLKLDSSGAVVWERTYGVSNHDKAYSIVATSDGGYAVAGSTNSKGAGSKDIWLLKLDSSGAVLWERTYGVSNHDKAYSIVATSDGGYAVAGSTNSKGAGSVDIWLLKLDSSGDVVWERTYGGSAWDDAESIVATSDGGYAVAGYTYSKGAGGEDIWLLKLDSSGAVVWERTYGGSDSDVAYSIVATSDGGYAVAGYTKSKGAGSFDIWLLKLDSSGAVLWERTYGGSAWDEAYSIVATSDGGYAVAGYTESKGAGSFDIWLLKLDKEGKLQEAAE